MLRFLVLPVVLAGILSLALLERLAGSHSHPEINLVPMRYRSKEWRPVVVVVVVVVVVEEDSVHRVSMSVWGPKSSRQSWPRQ